MKIIKKGIDGCHTIFKSSSNTFILCSWLDDYDEYKDDIKELLDLPDTLEIKVLRKESE